MHKEAAASRADLTLVKEDSIHRTAYGIFHVGIRKDNVGRLASKLQRNLLQVAHTGLQNLLAHLGRASKSDFVYVRMGRQRCSCSFAKAWDDIHHALGEARLTDKL